ncbi:MAG: asparagine--tRNA ligase [Bacteroidota bacterium]
MQRTIIQDLPTRQVGSHIKVKGWVAHKRMSKHVAFLMLQDGSSQKPFQIVADPKAYAETFWTSVTVGSSIVVEGKIVASQGKIQGKELQASAIALLGKASATAYPLQPKRHSLAFLRTIDHLRFRTQTFRALFRIRHQVSQAIHQFFDSKGFCYIHTPIITGLDAEGAGELFSVHTPTKNEASSFFGKPAYLTVSGQLAAEAAVLGLGKVYTFGPTFRAENSNTTRHLAEFWMVEPEMAFCDLKDCIQVAEALLKHIFEWVGDKCKDELSFLDTTYALDDKAKKQGHLWTRLADLCETPFMTISYEEAFRLLHEVSTAHPTAFTYPMDHWGKDLQTEHERYLVDHFKKPLVVTDYPKAIKPFYMRENEDKKTVACMDILLPGIGEVVGGSQREERYDKLVGAMENKQMDMSGLDWYLDTRRFGSVVHSGFGLGLERLVQFITGVENIRDTIPFPRTPGHAKC